MTSRTSRPARHLVFGWRGWDAPVALSVVLCICAAGLALVGSARASADPPLSIAPAQTIDGTNQVLDVTCVSTALCVAVDTAGNVLTSTDPASDGWAAPVNIDGSTPIYGVSCAGPALCVAVDGGGDLLTSTDPAGGSGAWSAPIDVDEPNTLFAVSCPSSGLCVAVDYAGNVVTSANPAGGADAWSAPVNIDGITTLSDVVCPSVSLCVAVDQAGDVLTSTDPTAGAGAWSAPVDVDGSIPLNALSCSSSFCAAVDADGDLVESSNPTGGASAWSVADIDGATSLNAISCLPGSCTAVDNSGSVLTQGPSASALPSGAWDLVRAASHALFAVSCPESGLCIAVGDVGSVVVGTGSMLTVALVGSGTGAVAGSSGAPSCPSACTAWFATGASVTLNATAAAGSTFAGWDGVGGCQQTGNSGACDLVMSSSQTVTATFTSPPSAPSPARRPSDATTITISKGIEHRHSATFVFTYRRRHNGFRCSLVRIPSHRPSRPRTPRYAPCRSPKSYRDLAAARYEFYVRWTGGDGVRRASAEQRFTIH